MKDYFNSNDYKQLQKAMQEQSLADENAAKDFWDNLSYDDQCNAFHAVVQKIYEGEVKVKGSYRYVLYDIFGFGPEMYTRGMECGYLDLHNSIIDNEYVKPHKNQLKFEF
jgi:hypothetical protein